MIYAPDSKPYRSPASLDSRRQFQPAQILIFCFVRLSVMSPCRLLVAIVIVSAVIAELNSGKRNGFRGGTVWFSWSGWVGCCGGGGGGGGNREGTQCGRFGEADLRLQVVTFCSKLFSSPHYIADINISRLSGLHGQMDSTCTLLRACSHERSETGREQLGTKLRHAGSNWEQTEACREQLGTKRRQVSKTRNVKKTQRNPSSRK